MSRFAVNILGCGSATPSLRHMPSCQVIDFRDTLYMIDCGEGAQLQMRRMHLKFSRLRHIFISHLHGDHFLGLPGLLSTMALHNTEGAVTIHTFAEGIDLLQRTMALLCHETSFKILYHEIKPEAATVFENDAIEVRSFPLSHRVPCVGYIFREKPKKRHLRGDMIDFYNVPVSQRPLLKEGADFINANGQVIKNAYLTLDPDPSVSYAYCSDTAFYPAIVPYIKGVDLLYHEATYGDDKEAKARDRGHSTAREAAEIARMADVKQLLIGHYSKSYDSDTPLLEQAREIFPNTTAVTEGFKIDLLP